MKKIKISELPQSNDVRGLFTIGTDNQNRSVKIPIGEVINEEISKVKRIYGYSRIDALTVGSSADDVATALIAENENKRTMPNVGDVLVDWSGVTRVPVVRQTVQTGGEKPIYSFSFRTADNTATKTVTIQGYLYEPQTVVSVETVKDVTQQQISTLDTQLAEEATARLNQDDVLEAKITEEKNARIAKDDVIFTVTKDTINDAETVGDANWAWALTPSVSDEELNARIAKRANFYVDVSLDTLGFLPYLKYIKLESVPENTNGVFSGLIPPASELGYVETINIKVKYNAKHKRWIALWYGADYIIPTATDKRNGLFSSQYKKKVDNNSKNIETVTNNLATEQTAREEADTAINGEIQGIKDKGTLHDLFLASGATYNQDTKMYQLNGLDLTFNEMLKSFIYTYPLLFSKKWIHSAGFSDIRTNIKPFGLMAWGSAGVNANQTFNSCMNLEVVDMELIKYKYFVTVLNLYAVFNNCSKLRIVRGFDLDSITNKTHVNKTFDKCSSLEIVKITNLKVDISFNDSPLLSKESIVYLINHASPSSPITITLHPTAYAMATADPEIQAELEKQPNISLAEGEPTA